MDLSPTPAPVKPALPVEREGWLELAGAAALDPAQAERVEHWLDALFGDDDETGAFEH